MKKGYCLKRRNDNCYRMCEVHLIDFEFIVDDTVFWEKGNTTETDLSLPPDIGYFNFYVMYRHKEEGLKALLELDVSAAKDNGDSDYQEYPNHSLVEVEYDEYLGDETNIDLFYVYSIKEVKEALDKDTIEEYLISYGKELLLNTLDSLNTTVDYWFEDRGIKLIGGNRARMIDRIQSKSMRNAYYDL